MLYCIYHKFSVHALAGVLRENGVECEYADLDHVVLMFAPDNADADYARVAEALAPCARFCRPVPPLRLPIPRRAMSPREAVFAPSEIVPLEQALGRVCAAPTVSCPPAIPLAVSGEIIEKDTAALFARCGVHRVRVVK